jgi:effector-binding domain-containing protein
MKLLKKIVIWLIVLIALLVVVAYLLPGSYHVERSILIKTDKNVAYDMVCDFEKWDLWTPWSADTDTTAVIENIGNCEVGAVQKWDGEKMGKGELKLIELDPANMLKWDLGFEGISEKMIMGMTFLQEGDDILVSWTGDGELGYNPLYRYMGLMIDSDLGTDYELGLQNLKTLCESLPDYPGISITELAAGPAISVKDSVAMADLGVFMETYMPQLYMYAIRQGGKMAGHPYSIYYNWDPEGMILVEVGIPLEEAIEGEDMIMPANTPGGQAVKATYLGPYEEMASVYEALEQYIKVMKLDVIGMAYEVYVTDPGEEADPAKWETIVYFPLK